MNITLDKYFAGKPYTDADAASASDLLARVNGLCLIYEAETGNILPSCPNTGSGVSGSKGGEGDGGFRLRTATTGRPDSSHKEAKGVDVYDPYNRLDAWITDEILEKHGLYREHPSATDGWCHMTTRPPPSGHRTFYP